MCSTSSGAVWQVNRASRNSYMYWKGNNNTVSLVQANRNRTCEFLKCELGTGNTDWFRVYLTGVRNLYVRWAFSARTSAARSKYWHEREDIIGINTNLSFSALCVSTNTHATWLLFKTVLLPAWTLTVCRMEETADTVLGSNDNWW